MTSTSPQLRSDIPGIYLTVRLRYALIITAILPMVIGGIWLALWVLGLPQQWAATPVITVKTNAALAMLLAGASLLALAPTNARWQRGTGVALAVLVLLIGGLTLGEHLFHWDLGIDQLLFSEPPGAPGVISPNRMGPPATISFTILGIGLLALSRRRKFTPHLGILLCLINLVPAVGYIYGAYSFYGRAHVTGIAWPTVLALISLGTGLVLSRPDSGPIVMLLKQDAGGRLLRRLLPGTLLLPLLIEYLRAAGEDAGVYGVNTGRALLTLALTVLFAFGLWLSASRLSRSAADEIKTQQALGASESLLRTVTDQSGVGLVLLDCDRRYLFANRAYSEVMGFVGVKVVGKRVPDLLGPVYDQISPRLDQAFLGEHVSYELKRTHPQGDERYYTVNYEPLRDGAGIAQMIVTVVDITKRKRAEEALRESEERWATTLQSIGDAVISTDAAGRIVFMNEVAQKLTGWPSDEARAQDLATVFNIVHEETRVRPEDPVSKVLRSGKIVGLANHTALIRRDGTEIPIDDSAAPIRNREGQVEGVVLVFHDVSEQRTMQKVLRDTDRLATTGRMAASIAHEIHNPLDVIGNVLHLIEMSTSENDTREQANMASEELQRLSQMTQQMLTFQRESTTPVPVQIRDVLDNIVALYHRKIESAGIKIESEVDSPDPIHAHPGELRQVFANLVGNAIEAVGHHHGNIKLHAYSTRNWRTGQPGLRVVVADNGKGIPPAVREKILEPFFTTKGEKGTGLGLWITAGIISKYQGTLRLRSTTRAGRSGTCFSVFFPYAEAVNVASAGNE